MLSVGPSSGRSPTPRHAAVAIRRPRCSYILVSAATIATLADRFGLTVDQVTNEFESWALCARGAPPRAASAHPSGPPATPAAAACRRLPLAATQRAGADVGTAGYSTAA